MRAPIFAFSLTLAALLAACTVTTHPTTTAQLGQATSSADMERVMDLPGPVQLSTINSANWVAPLSGLVNLKNPVAVRAGLEDRDEPIQIYAHWLQHPQYGNYLIDTGVSQKLLDDPANAGLNWALQKVMHVDQMAIQTGTAQMRQSMQGPLSGVFFTHLHIDHITGLPEIPDNVPLYIGKSESTQKDWINMFTQGATNQLLQGKPVLQEWDFQPDPQARFEGVIDVFKDGSVFAISVPGHTPGSTAYLVRTPTGPVLLTGDTSHTRWGWDNTVEPGDFTRDPARNLKNLTALKKLVERHPTTTVRLGHQP
jgi:N-acyl homoserine lactone hydrolase